MQTDELLNKTFQGYTIQKYINKGSNAFVYKGKDSFGKTVAIKIFKQDFLRSNRKYIQLLNNQINVMKKVKNPNVVSYFNHYENEKYFFIFFEYCNGGDLENYLETNKALSQRQATNFLKQIINGFKGLHKVDAMHRDFKVANVLLHDKVCKIADLGYARQFQAFESQANTLLGTPLTMAPEVLEKRPYGMEADIYSLGVVYYQLIFGKLPYKANSYSALANKIKNTSPDFTSAVISLRAKEFIKRCLQYDADKRISWFSIYEHPILYEAQQKLQQNQKVNQSNFNKRKIPQDIQMVDLSNEINGRRNENYKQYQQLYFKQRDSILFNQKFIQSYCKQISQIFIISKLTLFFTTKAALFQMKEYLTSVQKKKNIFKLPNQFYKYTQSKEYLHLIDNLKEIHFMMEIKLYQYLDNIDQSSCNSKIRQELNVQNWKNSHWKDIIIEVLQEYWFMLAQAINDMKGEKKKTLLKLIFAIDYYKKYVQVNALQFQEALEKIDYKSFQQQVITIFKSVYDI